MCRIELATKTITAESRIGSHKAVMGTIVPPRRSWTTDVPLRNSARAYARSRETVNHHCSCGDSRLRCPGRAKLAWSANSLNSQRLLNLPRNPRRKRLHPLFRLRLNHYTRQHLSPRIPHNNATVPIQLALGSFNRPLHLWHLRKRNLLPHQYILNF